MNPNRVRRVTEQLLARCDQLGCISDQEGQITRTYLSPATQQAHEAVKGWMADAGLTVRTDAVGNLVGRRAGQKEDGQGFLIGSHLDTVPNAGRFDGVLGTLAGIAVAELLGQETLPFALDVIGFSEEEGVRFSMPYLGSRAIAGQFDESLLALRDRNGIALAEAIQTFGLDPGQIARAAYLPEKVLGYLELHIEQGPVLEKMGRGVGVVTAIAGQKRMRVKFLGRAGHAGTCPMDQRQDALAAAAEWILAVEAIGRKTPGLVTTVGSITVTPNAPNVIPAEVIASLDVRHERDEMVKDTVEQLKQLAGRRGPVQFIGEEKGAGNPAVAMDRHFAELLDDAAGGSLPRLISGAGHDAAIMGSHWPAAMLFLRSPGGISHHPEESVVEADVAEALNIMVRFLRGLAAEYDPKTSRLAGGQA